MVCLSPCLFNERMFQRTCGHVNHWGCIKNRVPFACFVCRDPWQQTDQEMWIAMLSSVLQDPVDPYIRNPQGVVVYSPIQIDETQDGVARTGEAPLDSLLLCCQRNEFGDRSMHWSPSWENGLVWDQWLCYVCGRCVDRMELSTDFEADILNICFHHGRRAVVYDFAETENPRPCRAECAI